MDLPALQTIFACGRLNVGTGMDLPARLACWSRASAARLADIDTGQISRRTSHDLHHIFSLLHAPYLQHWCETVTVLRRLSNCRDIIIIIIIISIIIFKANKHEACRH